MINPFTEVNWQPERRELKKLGVSIGIGCLVVATVIFCFRFSELGTRQTVVYVIGIGGGVAGGLMYLLPQYAGGMYYIWYGISCCIGFFVANSLLAFFYFAIFTPLAVGRRVISRRDPLQLQARGKKSHWHRLPPEEKPPESYLKQW